MDRCSQRGEGSKEGREEIDFLYVYVAQSDVVGCRIASCRVGFD